jgi:hypothetical protein
MLWYALGLFVVTLALVLVARLASGTRPPRGHADPVADSGGVGDGATSVTAGASRSVPAVAVPIVAVLAVAAAVLATVQVIRVGHSGSSAVWEDVVKSTDSASAPR